jgi:tRNA dimethylallyltransferase
MTAPVLVIAGPTASGKSALAAALAAKLSGTVINADSMQLYRGLRILTAQPDDAALARAPHRLYSVLEPDDPASAGRWRRMAVQAIDEAHEAGRLPILVGGTGLYLRALIQGLAPIPFVPPAIRAAASALHAEIGGEAFRLTLAMRDPITAERLNPGDTQRLIRAYEVFEATGKPLSAWQKEAPEGGLACFTMLVMPPRPALHAAIDARFLRMMERGGLDEARALAARHLDPALPAMKALGVPALLRHLKGEISQPDAAILAQQATRQYAKRQATWFRHQMQPDYTLNAQYSERFLPEIFAIIRPFSLTR